MKPFAHLIRIPQFEEQKLENQIERNGWIAIG